MRASQNLYNTVSVLYLHSQQHVVLSYYVAFTRLFFDILKTRGRVDPRLPWP